MPGMSKNIFTVEGPSFIDTGVFFAAYNENDLMHDDAALLLISAVLGWFGKVYTSTYVVDETLTLTKSKLGGREAVRLAESLRNSKRISTIAVEGRTDAADVAFERFKEHWAVRGLSYTDCTTIALVEKMELKVVLSFDKGFRSLVPKVLGEGYRDSLPETQIELLRAGAKKLGVKLN